MEVASLSYASLDDKAGETVVRPTRLGSSTIDGNPAREGARYSQWNTEVVRFAILLLSSVESVGTPKPRQYSSTLRPLTPFSVWMTTPGRSGMGVVRASIASGYNAKVRYKCRGTRPAGVNKLDIGRAACPSGMGGQGHRLDSSRRPRAIIRRFWSIAPPTSVPLISLQCVSYPRFLHRVTLILHNGPRAHVLAKSTQLSRITFGRFGIGVRLTIASHEMDARIPSGGDVAAIRRDVSSTG